MLYFSADISQFMLVTTHKVYETPCLYLYKFILLACLIQSSSPLLEGVTEVAFVNGVAEFTRLRVNQPASNLHLLFTTNPGNFKAQTGVTFSVVAPDDSIDRKLVTFILVGDVSSLADLSISTVTSAIKTALTTHLDIDPSRVADIYYVIVSYCLDCSAW